MAVYPEDFREAERPSAFSHLEGVAGGTELMAIGAGSSFGNGIIRIHDAHQSRRAVALIGEVFPEYQGRVIPFAKDWLGRQFAVPTHDGLPTADRILLMEPGSGDAFVVDVTLADLFDQEMVEEPDTFLAADLFAEWRRQYPGRVPADECVGFKVPLFLGGQGEVENLEVSDEEVYWGLFGQLRSQVKG
nr:T6SS immunity protein Tdi1 domain-containing protein [Kitasatospora sp. SID7827]